MNDKIILNGYQKKLRNAIALKDYAIENNFYVPNEIIESLNNAEVVSDTEELVKHASNIDKAIRDLTAITYPTTIETIQLSEEKGTPSSKKHLSWFKWVIIVLSVASLILAIYSYIKCSSESSYRILWASILAASLGLMGTLTYVLFNVIGIIKEKAFNISDTYSNYARMALGPMIGWVFYFAFVKKEFCTGENEGSLLLLPFLAGFSTKLVIGVINQVLRAVQLTLGIEDKETDLRLRRRKGKYGGNKQVNQE